MSEIPSQTLEERIAAQKAVEEKYDKKYLIPNQKAERKVQRRSFIKKATKITAGVLGVIGIAYGGYKINEIAIDPQTRENITNTPGITQDESKISKSLIETVIKKGDPISHVYKGDITINKEVNFRTLAETGDPDTQVDWENISSINGASVDGASGISIHLPTAVEGALGENDLWIKMFAHTKTDQDKILYVNVGEKTEEYVKLSEGTWFDVETDKNGLLINPNSHGVLDINRFNQTTALK